MILDDLYGMKLSVAEGILEVIFDNPPINLIEGELLRSLNTLSKRLVTVSQADYPAVRVVVFRSANPDFFLAHLDLHHIRRLPRGDVERHEHLSGMHNMMERWRTMPQVTLAEVAGRARGGGCEFLLSLDMRFGARGEAILSQPEVGIGIIPGGSGTERLTRLVGRSRALEVVLGFHDFPADLAAEYGLLNRAVDANEITVFVDDLARAIARAPWSAVSAAKRAVLAGTPDPSEALKTEDWLFRETMNMPWIDDRIDEFFALGAQTPEVERSLSTIFSKMNAGT